MRSCPHGQRIKQTTAVEAKVTLLRVRILIVLIYSTMSKPAFSNHSTETSSRPQNNASQQNNTVCVLNSVAAV